MKTLLPILLLAILMMTARSADLSKTSEGPSPEGGYRLPLIVPKEVSRYEAWNMVYQVCGNLEICLKSENVVFYILTWPELKGGQPVGSGEYAGKVAIGRLEYALIKK